MSETAAGSEATELVRKLIEYAALGIELLAVAVIVAAIIRLAVGYLFRPKVAGAYERHKQQLSKGLLLGLELLVAADVVRTVVLKPTLINVVVLGLLVLIRTFLSWSLLVEAEGTWPWQAKATTGNREDNETTGNPSPVV